MQTFQDSSLGKKLSKYPSSKWKKTKIKLLSLIDLKFREKNLRANPTKAKNNQIWTKRSWMRTKIMRWKCKMLTMIFRIKDKQIRWINKSLSLKLKRFKINKSHTRKTISKKMILMIRIKTMIYLKYQDLCLQMLPMAGLKLKDKKDS